MKNKLTKYVIRILAGILGILTIAVTLFLFLYIFWKGKNVMSLSFILDKPAGVPLGTAGGIYPALMGSIYLGALSALMGGIIGIGVAVYLVFYTRKSIFYHVISACITGLSGIPSILFGLVGYTLLIYQFGLGRSLLCSAICVAVMIVPFIAIRAEKILKEKGTEYMKNSLALGMSREYAVIRFFRSVQWNCLERWRLEWHTEWERLHRFCIRVRLWSQMFRENLRIHLCHCRIICICW